MKKVFGGYGKVAEPVFSKCPILNVTKIMYR
jgi:hypothetical protein